VDKQSFNSAAAQKTEEPERKNFKKKQSGNSMNDSGPSDDFDSKFRSFYKKSNPESE